MARVCFDHVSKRFGASVALRDLTLEVEDREFFVLLGPSGCGKTTALRLVAGLEEPTEGRIVIGDRVVNEVAAKDRDLAMVFQNYALYPHKNVYENLAFGLRMRKLPRREIDAQVRATAAALGIEELLHRRPGELSGGQQQRVALGRAIVRRPQAFLMDEPLSNLDAKMRVQMRAELIQLHRRLGATILYVTHDQVEAMTMGQRIAVLREGALQQVGTPQEVYDRPANRFVAEFIGSPAMNFLEAEPQQAEGAAGVRAGGAFFPLPPHLWAEVAARGAKRLVLGIRPEHLALEAAQNAATLTGRVDIVESLGSELHLTIALKEATLVAKAPAHTPVRQDETVRLSVAPERLHLFDAETGARIG